MELWIVFNHTKSVQTMGVQFVWALVLVKYHYNKYDLNTSISNIAIAPD